MATSNQVKYYVRVTAGNKPILGSMVARKTAPSGNWKNIDACLDICCGFPAGTLETPSLVTTDGATGVLVNNWAAISGASNYRLERSTAADFTTALSTVYFGPLLTYSNSGLTTGTTYYYRLSAIGANTSAFATSSKIAP